MRVRIQLDLSKVIRRTDGTARKPGRRSSQQPHVECLEDRQLLASLQPITNQSVPAQQGAVIALLAQGSTTNPPTFTDPQTFTVTSSQPDILASIVQGPFWNVGVSYTDLVTPANSFSGTLTFQLFKDLTPNTVNMITQFTNDNYYVSTGKYFSRIVNPFGPTTTAAVVQGGAPNLNGSGNSGQPGTPFANENLQQLILTGTNQLSMANSGGRNSNDAQIFINTGNVVSAIQPPYYGYTTFGQLVTGQPTVTKMANVQLMTGTTQPANPLTITSTTFSSTDSNGVLLIDASHTTTVGETAIITVTATDSIDHTTTTQSFTVTIGAYAGPTDPPINFAPFANPTNVTAPQDSSTQLQLNGESGYPDTTTPATLTYTQVSQPSHGTVTNFNASTGTFTYTPNKSYLGPDSFSYNVSSTGPQTTPTTLTSLPGTVSITVGPVNTGTVQVIGTALVIQPTPKFHGKNTIHIAQIPSSSASGGGIIQVNINRQLDATQPAIGNIDRIIVFGGRTARNQVVVDPSVQVSTTIDSGHGTVAFLTGGGGPSREHGWFGHTTLIGGPGVNQLIGLAGKVKFKPTKATDLIFAGKPRRRTALLNTLPPGGTYYRFVDGHLVPISASLVSAGVTKANLHRRVKAAAVQQTATGILPRAI
jgi:cyclophilin family peptidyl-prolyl cis-trans isomerase